jgi:pimeloyl-ACP methyl ester carboxylesterase
MHGLGIGTTNDIKSVMTGIFLRSWRFPEYTLGEKLNLWRGKSRTGVSSVWDEMITTDLTAELTNLEIPTYFISGIYDYTVSHTLARDYLEELQAPVKGFYTFEESAHSPMFEEPERMQQILQEDVLTGRNRLADEMPVDQTS